MAFVERQHYEWWKKGVEPTVIDIDMEAMDRYQDNDVRVTMPPPRPWVEEPESDTDSVLDAASM